LIYKARFRRNAADRTFYGAIKISNPSWTGTGHVYVWKMVRVTHPTVEQVAMAPGALRPVSARHSWTVTMF